MTKKTPTDQPSLFTPTEEEIAEAEDFTMRIIMHDDTEDRI